MRNITVYTLEDMRKLDPKVYAKILKRWGESQDDWWAGGDVMKSISKVLELCGFRTRRYEISECGPSWIRVEPLSGQDPDAYDLTWFVDMCKQLGYTEVNGELKFTGLCLLTGYCADDDCLEHVFKALQKNLTMTEACQGLAKVAQQHCEADMEQQRSEETMLANWENLEFTRNGIAV